MTTPAEQALRTIAPLADSPSRRAAFNELEGTTRRIREEMRRLNPEFRPTDLHRHRLSHPVLQARISDGESLSRLGGEPLAKDMKELPAYIKTLGFPGFDIVGWPATLGQLYAVTLTQADEDQLPLAYGIQEKGLERIERSLVPLFQRNLNDPQFQEDTIAIQEFLAVLQERRIPPFVVIGGLGIVTGGDLSQIPFGELPKLVRSGMNNTASDVRTNSITLSEHEQNEALLQSWIGSLQKLHSDL